MAGQGREKGLEKRRNPDWEKGKYPGDRNSNLRDGRRRRRLKEDAERRDEKKKE